MDGLYSNVNAQSTNMETQSVIRLIFNSVFDNNGKLVVSRTKLVNIFSNINQLNGIGGIKMVSKIKKPLKEKEEEIRKLNRTIIKLEMKNVKLQEKYDISRHDLIRKLNIFRLRCYRMGSRTDDSRETKNTTIKFVKNWIFGTTKNHYSAQFKLMWIKFARQTFSLNQSQGAALTLFRNMLGEAPEIKFPSRATTTRWSTQIVNLFYRSLHTRIRGSFTLYADSSVRRKDLLVIGISYFDVLSQLPVTDVIHVGWFSLHLPFTQTFSIWFIKHLQLILLVFVLWYHFTLDSKK